MVALIPTGQGDKNAFRNFVDLETYQVARVRFEYCYVA